MANVTSASREILETPFRLDVIEEVAAPDGCEGVWQRYVIVQGENTIVGTRAGNEREVKAAVLDFVERLNLRFAKHVAKAR
jgi:hypothetical protein